MLCGLWAAWAIAGPIALAGDIPPVAPSAAAPSAPDAIRHFDIPAQPLDAALKRYAVVSDRSTLFPSDMAAGRTSSAVNGDYSSEEALRRLLDGTGLTLEKVDAGSNYSFILKETGASSSAPAPVAPGAPVDFSYGARVQARLLEALCANPRTAARNYRILLRFHIDAAGQVEQARLLSSTGNAVRDAALLETLRQLHIDSAPPPAMAQPLTMIVLPAENGGAGDCSNREARP